MELTSSKGTGELQPADTLLQRVVKHIIKIASLDYFVACSTRQLQAGVAPEAVVLPNNLPSLRDASVAWTLEAFRYMQNHREIVQKAWARCQTGEWDLTWDKLTSPAAKDLFYATLSTNEAFRNELGIPGPIVPRSRHEDEPGLDVPHDETAEEFESSEDDVTIPVEQLVDILTGQNVPQDIRSAEEGGWTRFGDEGDIEIVSAEPGDELQGATGTENNTETDGEPEAQTDPPEEPHATCVDNNRLDFSDVVDTTGNNARNIDQEQPVISTPAAEIVEPPTITTPSSKDFASTIAYNHGEERHTESDAAQLPMPDALEQQQSPDQDTAPKGNSAVTYAVDIAVLGGTHPAMYSDTNCISSTKRGRSGVKSKAMDTNAAGGSQKVAHETPTDQVQPNKRPRRQTSSRASKEVDRETNEPKKGRGRGRGRGRARTAKG
ncbi:hypothetical protein FRC12_007975 [Ceratobasidium sp. 428]|nr:hypothetical protein FRC12_007975 [Ceratobasidium sp. 428]